MKRGEALTYGIATLKQHGFDDPKREAQLLLERACHLKNIELRFHPHVFLTEEQQHAFDQALVRRSQHEPLAYILEEQEFYGRRFQVNNHVLIPRPETEELIDCARPDIERAHEVWDIGTGSGAIGVTIACEYPEKKVVCLDIDQNAIVVARKNAQRLISADVQIQFLVDDSFQHFIEQQQAQKGMAIAVLANLPYIPTSHLKTLDTDVVSYEPHLALDGGPEGTSIILRLLDALLDSHRVSSVSYYIFLEIDPANVPSLDAWVEQHVQDEIQKTVHKDLNQQERFYVIRM